MSDSLINDIKKLLDSSNELMGITFSDDEITYLRENRLRVFAVVNDLANKEDITLLKDSVDRMVTNEFEKATWYKLIEVLETKMPSSCP